MNSIEPNAMTPRYTPAVIFRGSPSQLANLPVVVKTALVLAAVGVLHLWFSLPWVIGMVPVVVGLYFVVLRFLGTALTIITIDVERITLREGILTKEVSSLELFRIQDVTFVQRWWEAAFGIATIVVHTSDTVNPRWAIYGMSNAEELRDALNRAAIDLRDRKGYREVNMARV